VRIRRPHDEDPQLRPADRDPRPLPDRLPAAGRRAGRSPLAGRAPDAYYVEALRAALEACTVIAATDTLRDNRVNEAGMMDDTRRVWAAPNTDDTLRARRMVKRPD
jgi:hypothetical protein